MRTSNPNVPWSPSEIGADASACRAAGASIVHFHARGRDGSASHEVDVYAETIRQIRSRCDVLVHPTLGQVTVSGDEARLAAVEQMARDPATRPDFAPMDMGSTNIAAYDAGDRRFVNEGRVYLGVKPMLCSWSVPFVRSIEAFVHAGLLDEPVMNGFVLTEGGLYGGHPGTVRGLEALLDFASPEVRMEWSVMCKHGNLFPAAMAAIERGGHVSIGLGDYPYNELGMPRNADLVAEIVRMARSVGRAPATPNEVRHMLRMAPA